MLNEEPAKAGFFILVKFLGRKALRFSNLRAELDLQEIRGALQKEWVLGDDKFKRIIEEKIGVRRNSHGGDRKSLGFFENQVL